MGNIYNCAFRVNEKRCSILTKKSCFHCPFYKTKEELEEKKKKAKERLNSLPERKRRAIYDKYYSGGEGDEEQR